ncbi:PHA/PHB synthase family protein [Novosphingobium sediminicola]|uniref:Polyhydroxyalkanoate synthase n=1 Tax=Novosphingobium sediminicola TaxID=563162 RepID=A0A7W6CM34_9SPHN|nr:alpha/beta fold hydrolase [Novosphingobium sediminicola]MBB3953977.1 polyhydroxyalkanoate synthase [Novosphingobium sediminicola]
MTDTSSAQADADPLDGIAQTLDHASFAAIAGVTGGLSPFTVAQAMSDWALHLAASPGRRLELLAKGMRKSLRLIDYVAHGADGEHPAIEPLPQDRRFDDSAWKMPPYNLIAQSFLMTQQWWHAATTGISGVGARHEAVTSFTLRQILDMFAPSNFIPTNPVLQRRIVDTGGMCLVEGARLLMADIEALARGTAGSGDQPFQIGRDIAATKGKVIYRNRLMELIQYEPTTAKVRPEPVLIVPAWIMKYYILDLSAHNSLIGWLVGQGYTVFAMSWHNPVSADRDLDMEDYRLLGPMAALDAITAITGAPKIHALGYCLGGTLLAIAAAAMARDGDERLAGMTLLAAQTEFSEPGELGLFIDEAQLNLLDSMMWERGYLDSGQMGGAFQMLRSNDLVWSRILNEYLMGERPIANDLMVWNADGTRMPFAMHSEYLHKLFLKNDLAEGRFVAGGMPVSLSALKTPMFVVGTQTDHVAPWRSVHKIHMLTDAEICFTLTNGGHNAGIVSEPGHKNRHYQLLTRPACGPAMAPDLWLAQAPDHPGSWWEAWGEWLSARSGKAGPPPPMGAPDKGYAPLADAPGSYILEK